MRCEAGREGPRPRRVEKPPEFFLEAMELEVLEDLDRQVWRKKAEGRGNHLNKGLGAA